MGSGKARFKAKITKATRETSSRQAKLYNKCRRLAEAPDLLKTLRAELRRNGVVGSLNNMLIVYLAIVSRLFQRPVSLVLKGLSCGGKSETVDAIVAFFPASACHELTSASDKALIYSSESFKHRILVVHEATGMSDAMSHLLRVLLSQGCIVHETTVAKTGGGFETIRTKKEGPTGLITTTTAFQLHPENETRVLSLTVKDTQKQTEEIFLAQAEEDRIEPDFRAWHALQDWLTVGPTKVTIPYSKSLAALMVGIAPRLRRDFPTLLSLIRAHALLHRHTRTVRNGKIVAKVADYRAVWKLVKTVIAIGVEATVSNETRKTVEAVAKITAARADVTLATLAAKLDLHKTSVSRRVTVAAELGYLIKVGISEGKKGTIALGDPMPEEIQILPTPKAVLKRHKALKATGKIGAKPKRAG